MATQPVPLETYQAEAPAQLMAGIDEYNKAEGLYHNNPRWLILREHFLACFANPSQIQAFIDDAQLPPKLAQVLADDADKHKLVTDLAEDLRWHHQKQVASVSDTPNTPSYPLRGVENVDHPTRGQVFPAVRVGKPGSWPLEYFIAHVAHGVTHVKGTHQWRGYVVITKTTGTPQMSEREQITACFNSLVEQNIHQNLITPVTHVFLHTPPENGKEDLRYYETMRWHPQKGGLWDKDTNWKRRLPVPLFVDAGLLDLQEREQQQDQHWRRPPNVPTTITNRTSLSLIGRHWFEVAHGSPLNIQDIDRHHSHHTLRRMRVAMRQHNTPMDPVMQ